MIKRIIVIWAIGWMVTWPALFADEMGGVNAVSPTYANRECRHFMGSSMFFAAIPLMWVLAPLLTGFYQYGIRLSCQAPPIPEEEK